MRYSGWYQNPVALCDALGNAALYCSAGEVLRVGALLLHQLATHHVTKQVDRIILTTRVEARSHRTGHPTYAVPPGSTGW